MNKSSLGITNNLIEAIRNEIDKGLPGVDYQETMHPKSVIFTSLKNTPPIKSSVMILIYPKNNIPHFVLIQRPTYDGAHSAQISLPGGKFEKSDSDIIATAKRETFEEIGVHVDNIIGSLTPLFIGASNFDVSPIVGYMSQTPTFVPDSKEVSEIIEISLIDFMKESSIKEKEIIFNNTTMITPYFDLDNRFVWGATAKILGEFREILNRIDFK